jgi:hypothetical protein
MKRKGSCQRGFPCFGKGNFPPLGQSGGILQRLHNILPLKVRIIFQQLLNGLSRANLPDNHTHRYPYTPDTGLSPHYRGILGNPVKSFKMLCFHGVILLRKPDFVHHPRVTSDPYGSDTTLVIVIC